MYNAVLKGEIKSLTKQKEDLEITTSTVGGCSIEIYNAKTQTDVGSYIYSDEKKRDSDLAELKLFLN